MRDAVVRPLRPEANLFCGCLRLGSGPFCVSGLLFLVAKRKSGWGILRVVRLGCVVFGSSQFTYFVGPFGSLYKMFYCLCSCKNRARERHRPYSRKEKICWSLPPDTWLYLQQSGCQPLALRVVADWLLSSLRFMATKAALSPCCGCCSCTPRSGTEVFALG